MARTSNFRAGRSKRIAKADAKPEMTASYDATADHAQHALSFYCITRMEDQHYLRGLIETIPQGVELVIVLTRHDAEKAGTVTIDRREHIQGIDYVFASYYYAEWDFAAARNAGLSLCTREWCFWVDTDDRLLPFQHADIYKITELPPGVAGVMMGCYGYQPPYEDHKRGAFYAVPHCRAHRKISGLEWRGKVHEQIEPQIKDMGYTIVEADIGVYHVGYAVDKETLQRKMGRNVVMLCQQIAADRGYLPDYYTGVLRNNLNTYLEMKGQ